MYIVFFNTSDVFIAESILKDNSFECEIVPNPVSDKAYCGICLRVSKDIDLSILTDLEYKTIEE